MWPQWWSFADLSQQGVDFSKKISNSKYLFDLTFKDVHTDRQKLGPILENKVVQKLKFLKNVNNKNVLLKWYNFKHRKHLKVKKLQTAEEQK